MKTIKRIVAVFLLILTVTVVGYLVFTGSRLADLQDESKPTAEVFYEQTEIF